MRNRPLGNSPLQVSELSFGTWLTVAGGIARDQSIRCIHAALDCGITLFDTANQYGAGEAERVLARPSLAIRATVTTSPPSSSFRRRRTRPRPLRHAIEKQLDRSLQRLGTDYIDLYQCHRYDRETPLEETLEALHRAVVSGKSAPSASANGPLNRSKPRQASRPPTTSRPSHPASRSIQSCGANPKGKCFPPARVTASAISPSLRSRMACSPANTRRASRRPQAPAPPAKK